MTAIYISRERWKRRKARETAAVGSCTDVLELSFLISVTKYLAHETIKGMVRLMLTKLEPNLMQNKERSPSLCP